MSLDNVGDIGAQNDLGGQSLPSIGAGVSSAITERTGNSSFTGGDGPDALTGGAARVVRVTVTLKRTPAAKKKQRAIARRR